MSVIALAGNPNCGKTTLFNRLTGSRYKVGNRAGVTVDIKEGKWNGDTLVDLPGVYSLSKSNAEECAAMEYLQSGNADVIVNIIDATNPERSLKLTCGLSELKIPMIIVLNMADMLEKSGFSIDVSRFEKIAGAPVILLSASKGKGVEALSAAHAKITEIDRDRTERILREAVFKTGENKLLERSIKADRVLLGSIFSGAVFASIMAGVFYLTFGTPGRFIGSLSEELFIRLSEAVRIFLAENNINYFLTSLICDGILNSIGGIVPFFGQILILFLCISVMEDIGYMSRIIFLADGIAEKLGIDARGAVPLIMGLGCSVPAALASKNIDDKSMRKKTVQLLPFISCSAKMPVYTIFASIFFDKYKTALIAGLYILGIASACVYAGLKKEKGASFVLELPPYRMPTLRNTLNQLREKLSDFVKRAGTVLFLAGIAVWLMQSFDFSLKLAASPGSSMLGRVGRIIAPVFAPCGFGSWQAAVALLSGVMEKEAVVSTLSVVYAGNFSAAFTPASAASFLVFVLFYPPCIAAVSAIGAELSKKETVRLVARQLAVAWAASAAVYFILK